MGHGIYLSDEELKILSKSKTAIAHCPTSNAPVRDRGLVRGFLTLKKPKKPKLNGLCGSDIGGGPFLSMFDVINSFVKQNKRKKFGGAPSLKA